MLLNEVLNNDPTIFVDKLLSVRRLRKSPRSLAQSLRKKADRHGSTEDTVDGKTSRYIDTIGQKTWTKASQNETPLNMGPKVRLR